MRAANSTESLRDGRLLIGSAWQDAAGGSRFDVVDPATGARVATVPDASREDVQRALDAADQALKPWRASTAAERGRLLRTAASLLRTRSEHIAATITSEQGKPLKEAAGEVE